MWYLIVSIPYLCTDTYLKFIRAFGVFDSCLLQGGGSVIDSSVFVIAPSICGGCVWFLFCCAVSIFLSSFAIDFLHCLSSGCHVAVNVLCLFLALSCVGLLFVIVAFTGHICLFKKKTQKTSAYDLLVCGT